MGEETNLKPYSDYMALMQLMKSTIADQDTIDKVEHYFKQYIDPYFRGPIVTNCTCSNSISTVFGKLRTWFEANQNTFKQDEE
ncbi:MAG: hypothetical protein BGO69_15805 [Bacteroidetes bacterium 46-16]|nr:MAG: hypothetical protein BGO69_15805 [Bacteroidetes bacterium 46-16]